VLPFYEGVIVLKERVFIYHHITEKALRQKPVKKGHKNPQKIKASGGRN
jgi:hypothetical protein